MNHHLKYSDGQFFWWVGEGRDPDGYRGPFPCREIALHAGAIEYGIGGFTLCLADRAHLNADYMSRYFVENVLEEILENNDHIVDFEADLEEHWRPDQIDRLKADLEDTISLWLFRNPPRCRGFGNILRRDFIMLEEPADETDRVMEDLYS